MNSDGEFMDCCDTPNRSTRRGNVDGTGIRENPVSDAVIRILGLPLTPAHSLRYAETLVEPRLRRRPRTPFLVSFANPLAVKLIQSDRTYRSNLERMDLVFCDGIALTWAARWIGRYPMARISFDSTSIGPAVFEVAQRNDRTIALVGGRPGVAAAAADRIRNHFPQLRIVAAIDGYRSADQIVSAVIGVDPDIVVCGMGAPRQEALLTSLSDAGWHGTGFTCGGYLDQLVTCFDFYPVLINRLDLRWLYRIGREPRRLGYRYIVEYAPFLRSLALELVHVYGSSHWRSRRS
ncbi:MAG TPA: WecB/TagA/CpsF family glycosyltransferase [Alphaproteobacteria bacterium]|jgi:N-acetylglucosaminyldiphosphoundecaprenol N-acetyl-beta-D-mannosaminyltransferase|nr:WecB/TagA/CpsF family glycosyltransferase [Alphaproteobacteria bacterium]